MILGLLKGTTKYILSIVKEQYLNAFIGQWMSMSILYTIYDHDKTYDVIHIHKNKTVGREPVIPTRRLKFMYYNRKMDTIWY